MSAAVAPHRTIRLAVSRPCGDRHVKGNVRAVYRIIVVDTLPAMDSSIGCGMVHLSPVKDWLRLRVDGVDVPWAVAVLDSGLLALGAVPDAYRHLPRGELTADWRP